MGSRQIIAITVNKQQAKSSRNEWIIVKYKQ